MAHGADGDSDVDLDEIGGNYNSKMGIPEYKDLMRFIREFFNWFPKEFVDAVMAEKEEN